MVIPEMDNDMNTLTKEKSITMAREITEAMITLEIALSPGTGEHEIIEAKNVVTQVLRSYRRFLESIPEADLRKAQELFSKRIEAMAHQAQKLG